MMRSILKSVRKDILEKAFYLNLIDVLSASGGHRLPAPLSRVVVA